MRSTFQVIFSQREGIIYKGAAEAVTAFNEVGQFDVLENHAQIISLIKDKIILHQLGGYRREFALKTGILSVANNLVKVFFNV